MAGILLRLALLADRATCVGQYELGNMKHWFSKLALVLSLPLGLTLFASLWVAYHYLNYQQLDNPEKLASKQQYLASIARLGVDRQSAPNIVFILFDDLGFGDLGFTGSRAIATPAIDQLATDGVVLENFYSPAPVCTPSRVGFLTGRLAPRAGIPDVVFPTGSLKSLLNILPGSPLRIPAEEITLADVLKAAGYRTAMVGKWHLGDHAPSLPNDMGFDDFFGALYSNDMEPFALYDNRDIALPAPVDQSELNGLYASAAEQFIEQAAPGQPLFLYYAHNFPHRPLYSSDTQSGQSRGGLYGDVVEDLDTGVARIIAALKASKRFDNTLIIVSSDNGPWYQGSAGADRGRKGETFEGGMHVPFLAHWPQGLPQSRKLSGMSMGTDLLPTLLDWLALPLPDDRIIDGKSIRKMLESGTQSPHRYLYYIASNEVMAVRGARFKYHQRRPVFYAPMPSPVGFSIPRGPWLFDTFVDSNESYDVSAKYPEQAEVLADVLADKRMELEQNLRGWK